MKVTPRRIDTPKKTTSVPRAPTWDHAKQALQRDWLQARSEVRDGERTPASEAAMPHVATRHDWEHAEPAVRYGFDAHLEEAPHQPSWTSELERKLARGWNEIATGLKYDDIRDAVKLGWLAALR